MTIGKCELSEPRVGEFEVRVNGILVKETSSIRRATEFIVRYNELSDDLSEYHECARAGFLHEGNFYEAIHGVEI